MYNFASPVGKFEIDWLKCVLLTQKELKCVLFVVTTEREAEGGIHEPDQTTRSMFIDNKWRLGHHSPIQCIKRREKWKLFRIDVREMLLYLMFFKLLSLFFIFIFIDCSSYLFGIVYFIWIYWVGKKCY